MRVNFVTPLCGLLALAGCAGTTDVDRAIIGAGAGAAAAHISGERDKTVVLGAIGGAAAGVLCDDVGVCRGRDAYYPAPQPGYTRAVTVDGRTVYVQR